MLTAALFPMLGTSYTSEEEDAQLRFYEEAMQAYRQAFDKNEEELFEFEVEQMEITDEIFEEATDRLINRLEKKKKFQEAPVTEMLRAIWHLLLLEPYLCASLIVIVASVLLLELYGKCSMPSGMQNLREEKTIGPNEKNAP